MDDEMNDRMVHRLARAADPDGMIRFVAGPAARWCPTSSAGFPGRGCWVTGPVDARDGHCAKNLFAMALKRKVIRA